MVEKEQLQEDISAGNDAEQNMSVDDDRTEEELALEVEAVDLAPKFNVELNISEEDDLTEEELRLLEEELALEGLVDLAPKFNVGDRVSIFGVKSRQELNGELAFIIENVEGGWQVKLPSGEEVSLEEEVLTAAPMKKKKKKGKNKKNKGGNQQKAAVSAGDAESLLEKEMAALEARRRVQQAQKEKAEQAKSRKTDAVAFALKQARARNEAQKEDDEEDSTSKAKKSDLKAKKLEHSKEHVGIRSWKKSENFGATKFIKP